MLPWPRHSHCRCPWPCLHTVTQAPHRVPTLPPPALPWQDEAESVPITVSLSTTGPRQQPQSSLACMSAACGSWAARLGCLVGRPRPAQGLPCPSAVSNHPLRPHVFTLHNPRLQPKPRRRCNASVASCSRPRVLASIQNKSPQASLEPPPGPICQLVGSLDPSHALRALD
jgi:hypothetical protein